MAPPNANDRPKPEEWDDALIQGAAAWRARIDQGLTAREESELAAWLAVDDRRAEILAEMDATWSLLDRTNEIAAEQLGGAAGPGMAVFESPVARKRRRLRWWAGAMAAAAAVVVMGTVWRHAVLARPDYAIVASAESGLVKRVNLPDGSTVRLNSDGAVRVEFTGYERRVSLERGEASFAVAKDPARPFVVRTAGVQVRAIGTVFTVSRRSEAVEVLVTEGKVRVDDAVQGGSLIVPGSAAAVDQTVPALTAGEKVVIAVQASAAPTAATPVVVAPAEIAAALAWQERRLDFFASTPLSEIAAEFNRFNHHQLVVKDPALADQRFAGSFRADDPETFVQLIETRAGVKVERRPGETVIRLAK